MPPVFLLGLKRNKHLNVESELCLFVRLAVFTIGKLSSLPYELMTQGDLNSTSKEGLRITNRVRMTEDGETGDRVYTTATKFRLPRKEGSVSTHAPQVEFDITEEDFNTVMGACESRYVKRRYSVELPSGVVVEIDRYLESNHEFSKMAKIDIEKADESKLDQYIEELRELGIHFSGIVNPPGVESQEIKDQLDELMSRQWNLAFTPE